MFYRRVTTCNCGGTIFKIKVTKEHIFEYDPHYEEAELKDGSDSVTDMVCEECGATILESEEFTYGEEVYLMDNDRAILEEEG